MKILVGYASGYGSTASYAEVVAEELRKAGHEAEVQRAAEAKDLSGYDYVVVGGSLRAGGWLADANKLARRVLEAKKPHSVFICCLACTSDQGRRDVEDVVLPKMEKKLPGINLEGAGLFPGARNMDQYGFVMRKMMTSISKKEGDENPEESKDYRDFDAARTWAGELAGHLA